MTFLGKTLILLTFLMSLMFMMGSVILYSTHRNWKEEVVGAEGLNVRLRSARETREQLEKDQVKSKNDADWEEAAQRNALAVLEVRAQQYAQALSQRQTEFEQLMVEHRTAIQTVEGAQANMNRLRAEIDALREEMNESKENRDQQFADALNLLDEFNQGEGQRQRLTERRQSLTEQISTGGTFP